MNVTVHTWRPVLRVLALVLALAVVPLPSLAEQSSPPAVKPGIRASVQKVAVPVAVTPSRVARSQGATAAPVKPSFLKTKAGIVVVGILAAGTGYALYSARHDRIHSPGRAK